jgi:hypothetical protein
MSVHDKVSMTEVEVAYAAPLFIKIVPVGDVISCGGRVVKVRSPDIERFPASSLLFTR